MASHADDQIALEIGKIFTPAIPIRQSDLFAGRKNEIRRAVDTVNQRGQHGAIFGDRGVGKTSLANIISSKLTGSAPIVGAHITCDSTDGFTSLWKKALSDIDLLQKRRQAGFQLSMFEETKAAADVIGDKVSPDDLRRLFTFMGDDKILIVVLDEFDRLNASTRRAVADTIKTFSDHAVPVTIILVGVAESITDLIAEHESISRALVQIHMPRMEPFELVDILNTGTRRVHMQIDDGAATFIARLSQGLPYYTHLLGLHSSRLALDAGERLITHAHVGRAINNAVEDSQASLRDDLRKAITSPQRHNIFNEVMLACSMAKTDEFGYFPAAAVREPLSKIRGKDCDIPSFARHLKAFCSRDRGKVLEKAGKSYRLRYRFSSPLMPPLIVMKGLVAGTVDPELLEQMT